MLSTVRRGRGLRLTEMSGVLNEVAGAEKVI